jgi:NarL family two-component system response regulator LiaR
VPSLIHHQAPGCIRVLVADDQSAVRQGLRFFLRAFDDLELIGEAADGQQALCLCLRLRPDVVLMDLAMPVMDGICATRAIRQHCPEVPVIVLTSLENAGMVQEAFEAGAFSCLLKNVSADQLAHTIRAACAGQPEPPHEMERY